MKVIFALVILTLLVSLEAKMMRKRAWLTGFQKECLDAHNRYRAMHGAPPLKWSAELANDAQVYANRMARRNYFNHDFGELRRLGEGENLAWYSRPSRTCNGRRDTNCLHCGVVVKDWYDEVKNYDFRRGKGKTPNSMVGHFTQIVWKSTEYLGMAAASGNGLYISARYKKPGNIAYRDYYQKNVLKRV